MVWYFLSQVLRSSRAARGLDTMGAMAVFPWVSAGSSRGRPAPQTTASTPAATAVRTASANCRVATMALTATIPAPRASSFALPISRRRARRLAPAGKSGS